MLFVVRKSQMIPSLPQISKSTGYEYAGVQESMISIAKTFTFLWPETSSSTFQPAFCGLFLNTQDVSYQFSHVLTQNSFKHKCLITGLANIQLVKEAAGVCEILFKLTQGTL